MSGRSIILVILALSFGIAMALLMARPGGQAPAPQSAAPEGARTVYPAEPNRSPDDTVGPAYQPHEFRDAMRTFLHEAAAMEVDERRARAEALRSRILEREAQGLLMPGESAYLQLALLRATAEDAASLRDRSEALLAQYQEKLEARWDDYRRKPDIRHDAYRAAEAEVVRRAMTGGPGALSQDELRQRLRALREQYYADEPLQ